MRLQQIQRIFPGSLIGHLCCPEKSNFIGAQAAVFRRVIITNDRIDANPQKARELDQHSAVAKILYGKLYGKIVRC